MRAFQWLFSFIFLMSGSVQAAKLTLFADSTVTTTAEILNRIQIDSMALIKAKYKDLQMNFTPHFFTTGLDFDCNTGTGSVLANSQYTGIRISTETKTLASGEIQTTSIISHSDCFGGLIFSEIIKAVGPKPALVSYDEAVTFARSFEVKAQERVREYAIEDSQSTIVFSVKSQRLALTQGERIYSVVEFSGSTWLQLDQLDPNPNQRRLYFQLQPGTFKAGGIKWKGTSLVLSTVWTDRTIEHYVDTLTSQVNFDNSLSINVSNMTQQMLSSIFSTFIARFPVTKKVESGVSDSPFLRELQLNYNRVLTNTEQAQVKLFLQKTIDDIKSGKLKVE